MNPFKSARDLYPMAFAVSPVLSSYALDAPTYTATELLIALAVAAALASVTQVGIFAFLRDRPKTAVLASLLFILAGTYGYGLHLTHALLAGTSVVGRTRFTLPAWTLAALAFSWLVGRGSLRTERWARFLGLAASGILIVTLGACALALVRSSKPELWIDRAPSAAGVAARRASGERLPDVFVLVLDEYASTRTMRDVFGFDNRPFVAALRSRGFRVADAPAAYSQTELSVASLLNLRYLSPLDVSRGAPHQWTYLARLLYDNVLFRLFKRAGYQVEVFWSGVEFTSHFRDADRSRSCFRLGGLAYAVASRTIASPLLWLLTKPSDRIVCVLRRLGSEDRPSSPRLVFAHVIAPHPPFLLKRDCSPFPGGARLGWDAASKPRGPYVEQVRCVNRLVLEFVDRALRRSGGRSVIAIVGDHGPGSLLGPEADNSWREPSASMLEERMGVLTAYFTGDRAVDESALACAGSVNALRLIADAVLGAGFPLLSERSQFSSYAEPFRFTDVHAAPRCPVFPP